MEKPVLGLKPRYLHDEERQEAIRAAIYRYVEAGKDIPNEWLDEYSEIYKRNQNKIIFKD